MHEAKFGMFIHWGLYSEMGNGEWIMHNARIPHEEYGKLADTFNPTEFNAVEWVSLAKKAGMKYITITAKHHDGFALFDTEHSAYNVVDRTPFKRDIIRELADECRHQGLKFCVYYSHTQDWKHPGAALHRHDTPWDEGQKGSSFESYMEEISLPQIKELVTNYSPDYIWFDTPFKMDAELGKKITNLVRSCNQNTLINSRLMYHGNQVKGLKKAQLDELSEIGVDFLSYRDREIPESSPWDTWETCMTLNHSWGYRQSDTSWKSPLTVIKQLVEVVNKGGCFLLNVGPQSNGIIPEASQDILNEVGDWLAVYGESIYNAQPSPHRGKRFISPESLAMIKEQEKLAVKTGATKLKKIVPQYEYEWLSTKSENRLYLHIFSPLSTPIQITLEQPIIQQVTDLRTNQPLHYTLTDQVLSIDPSQIMYQSETPSVIKISF